MIRKKKKKVKCLAQIQLERLNTVIKEREKFIPEIRNQVFLTKNYDSQFAFLINDKFFRMSMSESGGRNKKQLELLGITWPPYKGWKDDILGKLISRETANKFIELGKRKVIKTNQSVKITEPLFVKSKDEISWKEQYNHPNWQRVRLIIFNRDNVTCRKCGDNQSQLHVHHLKYDFTKKIWEINHSDLITLCEKCHLKAHKKDKF